MVYGIVVAGGQGTRLGRKKQFLDLAGSPVWVRAVRALLDAGVAPVWLVVPREDVDRLSAEADEMGWPLRVTAGGETRFDSVYNGLREIHASCHGADGSGGTDFAGSPSPGSPALVAVHDAARPFVSSEDVKSVVRTAVQTGAAILARPCAETVKRVEAGCVVSTVPRDTLWLAETPQVFRLDWMWNAYGRVNRPGAATDDAWVMEQAGYRVHVVPSTAENRKITTPADWEYARLWAQQRWGRQDG
ncbi:IspD/TarI family cytidylyltransferase [Alicyclobacillus macrosporangiidus]|uniref:2-C-methyl-D-erythritol 4-phosphate cytidylyltransferase/2-C-methyl-D-erythritol 4-phosphate cytidylyltransferase / 2-C-methyl-D-erythritol 2,4-cyclodiphosphate synthase n=1 Tax=Alicyclobacillus macrosporangiidus TaxID=392015 RepID=A0A1I7I5M2_9BACL|nr:IspD/TarI family cytidylyltransferase [Alicyclobacillus macrosporangiidus]SFU68228.1 2-C-methyl-D-erythritol 4-phosphate cytidylyltransferase/2-C-methyl-D-erythritol 4-phosphate cytidylyltransferase / 2-C-methyl-D-erythritol 2,4-cyclodiphosphate synthase [Alicyclobacillus macrosporangiidus]